jgi:hypothetical protein
MSSTQNYQYFPAIRCWIKHLLEGKFNPENNSMFTIFGEIKRVRLFGTIIDKSEFISKNTTSNEEKVNLRYSIDDGSGLIDAIKWEVNSDRYEKFNKGDIVSLVGRVNKWNEIPQVTLGHINKIENPNFNLLHESEIIFKITKGSTYSIPSDAHDTSFQEADIISEEEFTYNKESNTKNLFAGKSEDGDDPQEKVFLLIEENSQTGIGTSLEDLNRKLQIPKNKLITYLGHLERASRIYQSEDNVYQSY